MKVVTVFFTACAVLAILAFGFYFDIKWFLVGGIEQIVHAAQAKPSANVSGIVWGVVRVAFTGIVTWVAVVIALLVGKLGVGFAEDL